MPLLYIVARDRKDLYGSLTREFADAQEYVGIVLDRRQRERRAGPRPVANDRRCADRRQWALDPDLRTLGWALVRSR